MRRTVLCLVFLAAGCNQPGFPTSPTPVQAPGAVNQPVVSVPTTPPAPILPPGPAASLELVTFTLGTPSLNNGWYFYLPVVTLRETTGEGTAAVTSITYTDPAGNTTNISGAGCRLPSLVSPGGTWNISAVYLYCQDVDSREPLTSLTIDIGYVDAAGHSKVVSGIAR